jgi:hypothetical protein
MATHGFRIAQGRPSPRSRGLRRTSDPAKPTLTPNLALQRTRRPRIRSGRSLRSLRRPRQRAKVGPAGRGAEYATQGGDR